MKRIALFIVTLCLVFFLLPGYAKADESFPTLNSTSVVLMDAKTRRVLYEINPNEKTLSGQHDKDHDHAFSGRKRQSG